MKKNNEKTIYKSNDGTVEICELPEDKLAGRVKIKMSAHEVYPDKTQANENGISWIEPYVSNNLDSAIGMPYVVSYLNKDEGIPSGHGQMSYAGDGSIEFEGEVVGSVQDAYITTIDDNGIDKQVLMTEGYLYSQRNKPLIDFLKEQKESGNKIFGSVEINGKNGNPNIQYLDGNTNSDGSLKMDRVPTEYAYSGLAILYIEQPADTASQVLELNSKQKEGVKLKKIKSTQKVEINELSFDDIATIVSRAFNKIMSVNDTDDNNCGYCYDYKYCIYKLYPVSGRVIMQDWSETPYKYYMTTYTIQNNDITLGDISEVEQDWKPVDNEQEAEINASLIKNILSKSKKEEVNSMDDKVVLELNQKVENKTNEINELNNKNAELNAKNTELSEAVTNANKTCEEVNAKVESLTEELNSCKTELEALKKEKADAEDAKKKAEVNSYFETEIPKNKFADEEINSLKPFVDAIDLDGLKNAEAEICAKKFKEMISKEDVIVPEVEVNSKHSFIAIHEPEKKVIADKKHSFFN